MWIFQSGPPFCLLFPIISIICPLPTSEALSAFLSIWYSDISLPRTKICFSFLCCYNKLPQTWWLITIELFFFLQFYRPEVQNKYHWAQNHSVSARFRGKSISCFCQSLVTLLQFLLLSSHHLLLFCLWILGYFSLTTRTLVMAFRARPDNPRCCPHLKIFNRIASEKTVFYFPK